MSLSQCNFNISDVVSIRFYFSFTAAIWKVFQWEVLFRIFQWTSLLRMSILDIEKIETLLLVNMKRYRFQQRIQIIKIHHKNGENLAETFRKILIFFGFCEVSYQKILSKKSNCWNKLVMWSIKPMHVAQEQVKILGL